MSRQYLRVNSIEELLAHLNDPGAMILCGGTDLVVKMRNGLISPQILLDISELAALRDIRVVADGIQIGAAVTVSEILASAIVREHFPLLTLVLAKLGSIQIRNRATLGGNLINASPAADSAVPLLLFNTEIILTSTHGERRLPVEDFFLGPGKTALTQGEFLQAILIPLVDPELSPFFRKVGRRKALTIAIASLGALLKVKGVVVEEARFAACSVAPTPIRLRPVEEMLNGEKLTLGLIEEARKIAYQSVSPIDDIRASADYRRNVTADLLARLLEGVLHV